jgi:hypothetical protein
MTAPAITVPKSPKEKTAGLMYFPRMLDKIRLQAAGKLDAAYQENYGKGVDGWCTDFLRVPHPELEKRVAEGGTDEEIFEWCQTQGRGLNRTDIFVWNQFVLKLGWNDIATKVLERQKAEAGMSGRVDIVTLAGFMDADEGR